MWRWVNLCVMCYSLLSLSVKQASGSIPAFRKFERYRKAMFAFAPVVLLGTHGVALDELTVKELFMVL